MIYNAAVTFTTLSEAFLTLSVPG